MTEQISTEKTPPAKRINWAKLGIFFSTFGIVIFISALAYGYFQLARINISFAQAFVELKNEVIANQNNLTELKKSVATWDENAQKSQELSTKQEHILADWQAAQKGDLNKWYLAEAQYLIRLANDHIQFTGNFSLAITLLQRADQVLQSASDANLLTIRKSLATDIANLQAAAPVDITTLYLQFITLNNQLDQLPLPVSPLIKTNAEQISIAPPDLPWWKMGLQHTLEALRKIVIIRKDTSTLPLVLPEEKIFLYQNLHAQMESILWAVLNHNTEVYQASLARTIMWIQRYFDQDAALTKTIVQNLQTLQNIHLKPTAVNLSATLQLFDRTFTV